MGAGRWWRDDPDLEGRREDRRRSKGQQDAVSSPGEIRAMARAVPSTLPSSMNDTRTEAEAVQRAVVLRQSHGERLSAALRLSEQLRDVALMSVRARYPHESLLSLIERLTGEPMIPGVRSGPVRTP